MRHFFFCLFLLGMLTSVANAQVQFLLQNRKKADYTKVFDNINKVYESAQPGDTIYLPGAKNAGGFTFSASNLPISKKLHWIGVGTTVAKTPATGRTIITNTKVTFTKEASGSTIEGVRFYALQFGTDAANKCNNIVMKRCIFKDYISIFGDNFIMTGCLGYSFYDYNGTRYHVKITGNKVSDNCLLKNNILTTRYHNSKYGPDKVWINGFNNSIFSYNTLNGYTAYIANTVNCQVNNSILVGLKNWSGDSYGNTALRFNNCAFWNENGLPYNVNEQRPEKTIGHNCITNINPSSLFIKVMGSTTADYLVEEQIIAYDDFHLKDGHACKTASTTGGEIGAYGDELYSFKSIPFFPHIEEDQIGFSVYTKNGKQVIDAKVKVSAQSR